MSPGLAPGAGASSATRRALCVILATVLASCAFPVAPAWSESAADLGVLARIDPGTGALVLTDLDREEDSVLAWPREGACLYSPFLRQQADGTCIAAWTERDAEGCDRVWLSWRESGVWMPHVEVWRGGPGESHLGAAACRDPAGVWYLVWSLATLERPSDLVVATGCAVTGWTAPRRLRPPDGVPDLYPSVDVDPGGAATVRWCRLERLAYTGWQGTLLPDGTWTDGPVAARDARPPDSLPTCARSAPERGAAVERGPGWMWASTIPDGAVLTAARQHRDQAGAAWDGQEACLARSDGASQRLLPGWEGLADTRSADVSPGGLVIEASPLSLDAGPVCGRRNIVCFGDSITRGEGASSYPGVEKAYPTVLYNRLTAHFAQPIWIYIAARSGESTFRGLDRLPGSLELREPKAVFIVEGTNDCLGGYALSDTVANLSAMYDLCFASGAQPFAAEMPPISCLGSCWVGLPANCGQAQTRINTANSLLATLVASRQIPFIRHNQNFRAVPNWNAQLMDNVECGIHPDDDGYSVMGNGAFDAYVASDADGDGVPDAYELTYFCTLEPRADSDDDGDLLTLFEESLFGTNPIDPSDYPHARIAIEPTVAGRAQVLFSSVPGRIYSVERASRPGGAWTAVPGGPWTATGQTTRVQDPVLNPAAYYRVLLQP